MSREYPSVAELADALGLKPNTGIRGREWKNHPEPGLPRAPSSRGPGSGMVSSAGMTINPSCEPSAARGPVHVGSAVAAGHARRRRRRMRASRSRSQA